MSANISEWPYVVAMIVKKKVYDSFRGHLSENGHCIPENIHTAAVFQATGILPERYDLTSIGLGSYDIQIATDNGKMVAQVMDEHMEPVYEVVLGAA